MQNLPSNKAAETALLAAVVLDCRRMDTVAAAGITPDHFAEGPFAALYDGLLRMFDSGRRFSIIEAWQLIEKERINLSEEELHKICDGYISRDLDDTIAILDDNKLRRDLIEQARRVVAEVPHCNDAEEYRQQLEEVVGGYGGTGREPDIAEVMAAINADMQAGLDGKSSGTIGLTTGFHSLDSIFDGGLRSGGVYYVAGEKGAGKTTLACNIVDRLLLRSVPVGGLTLEMGIRQFMEKMLGIRMGSNVTKIITGRQSPRANVIDSAVKELSGKLLHIASGVSDTAGLRAWARRAVGKHGVRLLFVDYVQRLKPAGMKSLEQYDRITAASEALTDLALELEVPILCVSALSREGRLRGSGQLDYDAYGTLILTKDHEMPAAPPDYIADVDCFIDKNRFGPCDITLPFRMHGATGRYEERDRYESTSD